MWKWLYRGCVRNPASIHRSNDQYTILSSCFACPHPHRRLTLVVRYQSTSLSGSTTKPLKQNVTTQTDTVLRPYQEQCLARVIDAFKETPRLAVSLPTGSGKTVIFSSLIPLIKAQPGQGSKTLIIVNRREIAHQVARTIHDIVPSLKVVLELGNRRFSDDPTADVCVASIMSITSKERIKQFDPRHFKLIIIDEAHHSVAKSYVDVSEHFDLNSDDSRIYSIGFSATMFRHDRKPLSVAFDDIAFHGTTKDMIEDGHLANVQVTEARLFDASEDNRESLRKDERNVLQQPDGISLIIKLWKDNQEKFKSTVVFAINRAHIMRLVNAFREQGIDARYVIGSMDMKSRDTVISEFAAQLFPVLINCTVLTEGTDIPIIDQVIIATPIRSVGLMMQMVGRGLRNHPSKSLCNIVVFPEMQQLPCLDSLLPRLDGITFVGAQMDGDGGLEFKRGNGAELVDPTEDNVKPVESIATISSVCLDTKLGFDAFLKSRPESWARSFMSWARVGKKLYLFKPFSSGSYYRIDKDSKTKLWKVHRLWRVLGRNRSQVIYFDEALQTAVHHAELAAAQTWGFKYARLASKTADWRNKSLTDSQRELLTEAGFDEDALEDMDRGVASNLISLKLIGYGIDDSVRRMQRFDSNAIFGPLK